MAHSLICTFLETHTLAVSLEMPFGHGFVLRPYSALFIPWPGQAGSCLGTRLLNSVVPRGGEQPAWRAGHPGGTSSEAFCDFPARRRAVNKRLVSSLFGCWQRETLLCLWLLTNGGGGSLSCATKRCESDGYCENLLVWWIDSVICVEV